ncbi:hypothetical protein BH11BAC6_BH11BAC6_01480 [soil metagenome]
MILTENFPQSPFNSFWMGGFECSDKLNAFGHRVDLLSASGHLRFIDEDYKRLKQFNISTVREGIRWSQVETTPYQYNWTPVASMIEAGIRNNIQQVWDLCHFGYPDDLTPLHPMFARRFAALCRAFVKFYRTLNEDGTLIITPINEVSFISWLGGDARGTSPYCVGQGWEVKYRLMKAYIEGVQAIKETDSSVKILTTEPLVNVVPPLNADLWQVEEAARQHEHQFQVLDILCGRTCPELNGRPEYIDMLGFNYYYNNQWITDNHEFLVWKDMPKDFRWKPLNYLLSEAYKRYQIPIVLTETSHPKEDRPLWITTIARECAAVIEAGVPLYGICLYPIIDRPDWDNPDDWHQSGLWDIQDTQSLQRVLHQPSADALLIAQNYIATKLHQLNYADISLAPALS